MRIVVLCATDRGLRALRCLRLLAPRSEFLVVTFPEFAKEPPYVEALRSFCQTEGCDFLVQSDVSKPPVRPLLESGFDLLFCFSWRYMVSPEVYRAARLGSYVIHDSLLPKYRGFSPAIWALINGEPRVGVTLFEMAEEVDSGRVVGQKAIVVQEEDDIGTIREKGTQLVLELLAEHFSELAAGTAKLAVQDESEATYTCKWVPSDARIRWRESRRSIFNLVRATTRPYPGAFAFHQERKLTVWRAGIPYLDRPYASHLPGAVCSVNRDGSVGVLTGDGELLLHEVSLDDGPPVPAATVLSSLSTRLN